MRVLDLAGSPEAIGALHGSTYREEIRAYTAERVELAASPHWSGNGANGRALTQGDILDLADSMVAAHETHSPALAAEMLAMAEAAGITPGEAVIVGGFTDFVDTVRAVAGGRHPDEVLEDDCTAVLVPDALADGTGIYGQTWDMHDTATHYVTLFRITPEDAPAALVFTTTGALGQIGMNEVGVCLGINNLIANDGAPGVTWPQVVRHALMQESATAARDAIMAADLAGGHNFLILDADGVGFSIEAMPSVRAVDTLTPEKVIVHTNHTLYPETRAVEGERSAVLMDSSQRRLETAYKLLERPTGPGGATPITLDDVVALTREPSAICQVAAEPYHIESSGGAVMRPRTKEFWACWGLPSHNDYEKIDFPG